METKDAGPAPLHEDAGPPRPKGTPFTLHEDAAAPLLTLPQIRTELARLRRPLENARSMGPVMAGAVLARIAELVDALTQHVEEVGHRLPVPFRPVESIADELERHSAAMEAVRGLPADLIGEAHP